MKYIVLLFFSMSLFTNDSLLVGLGDESWKIRKAAFTKASCLSSSELLALIKKLDSSSDPELKNSGI